MPRGSGPSGREDPVWRRLGALARDRTSGATHLTALALGALDSLAQRTRRRSSAETRLVLRQLSRVLPAAQPGMGAFVRWGADLGILAGHRGDLRVRFLRYLANERRRFRSETLGILRTSRARMPRLASVVTLSRSSTVLRVLRSLPLKQRPVRVTVLRSLPGGEGTQMAMELRSNGIPARVVADRPLARALRGATLVLLGADAVLSDGALVHKVGTRDLGRAAVRRRIPVVSLAPRSRWVGLASGEFHPPTLFDVTPAKCITEFWTEAGVRSPRRPAAA
ncbi:MAG TPA: hypothetical protein VGS18_02610 [Thermoplasmata archaeon]|nr:hypothetical protein [Thermoplasmata archaeon]